MTTRAKELERETEFVQRSTAQLDRPIFAQTTVFGWMDTPEASYPQLRHVAASLGVSMSSQAAPYSDGNLRQIAGLSDHALAHAYQVLAGTQSQYGQSTASDAVDGSGTGLGRGRSDLVGVDSAELSVDSEELVVD